MAVVGGDNKRVGVNCDVSARELRREFIGGVEMRWSLHRPFAVEAQQIVLSLRFLPRKTLWALSYKQIKLVS